MQAMYDIVAKALKSVQLQDSHPQSHPQDYLNFYCLGNREKLSEETLNDNGAPVII